MLALVFWNARRSAADPEQYRQALLQFHATLNQESPKGFRYSCTFAVESIPWFRPTCEIYEDWYVVSDYAAIDAMNALVRDRSSMPSHDYLMRSTAGANGALYGLTSGAARIQSLPEAYWLLKPRGVSAEQLATGTNAGRGFRGSFWTRSLALGPHEHLLLTRTPVDVPDSCRPIHVHRELLWQA